MLIHICSISTLSFTLSQQLWGLCIVSKMLFSRIYIHTISCAKNHTVDMILHIIQYINIHTSYKQEATHTHTYTNSLSFSLCVPRIYREKKRNILWWISEWISHKIHSSLPEYVWNQDTSFVVHFWALYPFEKTLHSVDSYGKQAFTYCSRAYRIQDTSCYLFACLTNISANVITLINNFD